MVELLVQDGLCNHSSCGIFESTALEPTLVADGRQVHVWLYSTMCCATLLLSLSWHLGSKKAQVAQTLWCFSRQSVKLLFFVGRLLLYVTVFLPLFFPKFVYYIALIKGIVKVRYSNASLRHTNDIYLTKAAMDAKSRGEQPAPTAPVIFLVPGGAWIIGHKFYGAMMCRVLRSAGFLCVVADYRYWPQVSMDGMAEDVDSALDWTFKNIAQFGGDPKRVTIVSHSSGAHIVTLLLAKRARSTLSGEETSSWRCSDVFGFVGLAGVYHLSTDFIEHLYKQGFYRCLLSVFGKSQEILDDRSATVLLAQQPELVAELPPMLLVHDAADKISPPAQSVAFHSLVEAGGGRAHLSVRPGGGHNDPVVHEPMMSEHGVVREIILSVHRWGTEGFANGTDAEPSKCEDWKKVAEDACEEELGAMPTWPRAPSPYIDLGRYITPF